MNRRFLLLALVVGAHLVVPVHAGPGDRKLPVSNATLDQLRKLRAEKKFLDLPGAPAYAERRRLEPLINDLLDRLIAGVKDNATRDWVIAQMDPTVAKFHLEDTEARERCVVYLDRVFSILGMPGPEGAFMKYFLEWKTPLPP